MVTTIEKTHRVELTADDILELLKSCPDVDLGSVDARSVTVYVDVPGGGDWSNERLHLSDRPLYVEWTVSEELETERQA